MPEPDPERVTLLPAQMEASEPALTLGKGVTVTTTTSLLVQFPEVTVSVYEVVEPGVAIGFVIVDEFKPVAGDQLKVPEPDPESVTLLPAQTVTSEPALAVGKDVTATTIASLLVQFPEVTVSVYEVVEPGVATGVAIVDELKPVAGDQLKVPEPDPESVILLPAQTVTSEPALAVGKDVTVTTIASLLVQFPEVTVSVYEVVEPGVAIGVAVVDELNPVAGDQLKVPEPEPDIVTLLPAQMETSGPAFTVGKGVTVTNTSSLLVQFPEVTVSV